MTNIITPAQLKEKSLVDVNVADFLCETAIKTAQEIGLVSIIGDNLYNKIISLIVSNTLTGEYKNLVDYYIIDYLCFEATAEIQIPLSYKNRNSGVVRTTDEHTESAALKELQYITDYYRNRAISYSKKMQGFIIRNKTSFPEFLTEDCTQTTANDRYNCPLNI